MVTRHTCCAAGIESADRCRPQTTPSDPLEASLVQATAQDRRPRSPLHTDTRQATRSLPLAAWRSTNRLQAKNHETTFCCFTHFY